MVLAKRGRGGRRAGAGRPSNLSKRARELQIELREVGVVLNIAAGITAAEYENMIRKAIDLALGRSTIDGQPNIRMLQYMLDWLPKMAAGQEADEDSPIVKLVKELKAGVVNITQIYNAQSAVGTDRP